MQELPRRCGVAPAVSWIYSRSSIPNFTPLEQQYRDAQLRQHSVLMQKTSQLSQTAHPVEEAEKCQNSLLTEPPSTQEEEVSISLQEMVTHLQVALRASERAREEGCSESSALRRYLAEVEVAAAGLVSRVQELEHLLTLSTASQENKDLDQLRGEMLMVTARDARQHTIAAAQAISTARQATMQLDKVTREASALTASQEEEITRLSIEIQRCHELLQRKDILLQEKEKEEEKLVRQSKMHRCMALEGVLNASQLEHTALRKQIEVLNKEGEEQAVRFEELLQTLAFSKAAARAAENRLQEAQSQKKDTAIQNELLQHEVADLQSREVQTTIAHYDFELCKVRAVLEGEKTHLLAELAKLRQGNQNLKGEVAEWRGKYNNMLENTNYGEELVPANFGPADISCAKLRKFFMRNCLEEGSYLIPDSINATSKETKPMSGVAPMSLVANPLEVQDTPVDQQLYVARDDEEHLKIQICARGGENILENVNSSWRVKFQERNGGRAEPLLISDRSESYRSCTAEKKTSTSFDNQLCVLECGNSENGQICLAGTVEDESASISEKPLGPVLQASNPVEGREHYFDSKGTLEAEGTTKTAKKLRSVSFVDRLICGPEDGTLALRDETCFEMGENLLAVAHRELCKLKWINQQLVAACQ